MYEHESAKELTIAQSCQDETNRREELVEAERKILSNKYNECVKSAVTARPKIIRESQGLKAEGRPMRPVPSNQRMISRTKTIAYATRKQVAFGMLESKNLIGGRNKKPRQEIHDEASLLTILDQTKMKATQTH